MQQSRTAKGFAAGGVARLELQPSTVDETGTTPEEVSLDDADSLPKEIPLQALVFSQIGADAVPQDLFREILEGKTALKAATRIRVEAGIRSDLKLQGFRDASKAPTSLLSSRGGFAFCFAEHLSAVVLEAWLELRSSLANSVAAYLVGNGVPAVVPESFPARVSPSISPQKARDLAEGFLSANPGTRLEEVGLMVVCLTALAPCSEGIEVTTTTKTSAAEPDEASSRSPIAHFASSLAELRDTPSESPIWDEVEAFIECLRELTTRKLEERLARSHNLEERLAPFRSEYDSELSYLSMKDISSWTAERFAGCDVAAASGALAKLSEILNDVRSVRGRICDTIEDDEKRQRDLQATVTRARELFDALLTLPSGSEELPSSPGASAETTDAPESTRTAGAEFGGSALPVEELALAPLPPPAELPSLEESPISEATVENDTETDATTSVTRTAHLTGSGESRTSQEQSVLRKPASAPAGAEKDSAGRSQSTATDSPSLGQPPLEERLSSLSDEDLAAALKEALRSSAEPQIDHRVYVDLQVRWLLRGQNLRAYILAEFMEKDLLVSWSESAAPAQGIPSWLCWLALLMSDPGALRLGYNISELVPFVLGLDSAPETSQRFFAVWLGVGLTGPAPELAMQIGSSARPKIWDGWAEARRIDRLLTHYVLEPARCARRPQLTAKVSAAPSPERYEKEIKEAERVLTLASNYSNAAIKRYWGSLVGAGGPARELLQAVRDKQPGVSIPEPEDLANRVEGWRNIQSRYHNNILSRLSHFLEHLRIASSVLSALEVPVDNQSNINSQELGEALADGGDQARRFRERRSPLARGYEVLVDQLTSVTR